MPLKTYPKYHGISVSTDILVNSVVIVKVFKNLKLKNRSNKYIKELNNLTTTVTMTKAHKIINTFK